MKKTIVGLSLLLFSITSSAQEISVEDKMYGVELGLIKADVFYEFKLDRKWAVRAELAADLNTYSYFDWNTGVSTGTLIPLSVVIEPRFYYGIDRRNRLGRNITHNSSNFFSLKTAFSANRIPIYITEGNTKIANSVVAVPTFGIRRSFAKNFNYEFAFGIGLKYSIFSNSNNCNHLNTYNDIQAKIGYTF